MALTRYQRFSYRLLGPFVEHSARANHHLRLSLQRAHITLRPEAFLAFSYFNVLVAFASTTLFVVLLGLLTLFNLVPAPPTLFAFLIPLPLALAFVIYLLTYMLPDLRANARARDIDAKLPYALNYISSMASVGVTPEKIFHSLAEQPIYGEVANEAAWITRDLQLLGRDLLTALSAAIDRSPSTKFQDFLQGSITALSSGENLKDYFLAKSEQFIQENRQEQKRFLDNLGVLAESYVTVVVAAPLLLIVLLSVMIMFGGLEIFTVGYILILVLLPMAMYGFASTIHYMTPKV